ncbi:unnamed protein product, partial [marine sediment metagenome]
MAYQERDAYGKIWTTKLDANNVTPEETLGALRELSDGRKFRYLRMTGTAGALGQLLMPATLVAVGTPTAASGVGPDGATTTIITDVNATWTPNDYIGWYWQTATGGTGSQEPLKIVGNTATTLTLEKSIATTLHASTDTGEIVAGTAAGILVTGTGPLPCIGVCIGTLT